MILKITYVTITAAIISTVALVVLTHIPNDLVPQSLHHYDDKKLHFAGYAVVAFLYGLSFSPKGVKGLIGLLTVAIFVSILAAVDEYSQQYFGRMTDINDYYADLKGIATGVGAAFAVWLVKTIYSTTVRINISR
jgi:VanZ family protein